jgi:hypothetical protein
MAVGFYRDERVWIVSVYTVSDGLNRAGST